MGKGSGRMTMTSASVNTAVATPIPMAIDATITAVASGLRRNVRWPNRTSWPDEAIQRPIEAIEIIEPRELGWLGLTNDVCLMEGRPKSFTANVFAELGTTRNVRAWDATVRDRTLWDVILMRAKHAAARHRNESGLARLASRVVRRVRFAGRLQRRAIVD